MKTIKTPQQLFSYMLCILTVCIVAVFLYFCTASKDIYKNTSIKIILKLVENIKLHSFLKIRSLVSPRNPINSDTEAIEVSAVPVFFNRAFISALVASGYRKVLLGNIRGDRFTQTFLPCPVGTFSNSSSKGENGCTKCSPGNI